MKITYPSQQEVRLMFEYQKGNLINRHTRGPSAVKGSIAGTLIKTVGYQSIVIKSKRYQTSRLIWIYHNGDIPDKMVVDHINRDTTDNRIENLRLATFTQNEYNKPRKGCSLEKGKWRARIKVNGRNIHLGLFDTEDAAVKAYQDYAQSLHGEYQCS